MKTRHLIAAMLIVSGTHAQAQWDRARMHEQPIPRQTGPALDNRMEQAQAGEPQDTGTRNAVTEESRKERIARTTGMGRSAEHMDRHAANPTETTTYSEMREIAMEAHEAPAHTTTDPIETQTASQPATAFREEPMAKQLRTDDDTEHEHEPITSALREEPITQVRRTSDEKKAQAQPTTTMTATPIQHEQTHPSPTVAETTQASPRQGQTAPREEPIDTATQTLPAPGATAPIRKHLLPDPTEQASTKAPKPCNVETVRKRVVKAGESLEKAIGRWASADGWNMLVRTEIDWIADLEDVHTMTLAQALERTLKARAMDRPAPRIVMSGGNCTLRLTDVAH